MRNLTHSLAVLLCLSQLATPFAHAERKVDREKGTAYLSGEDARSMLRIWGNFLPERILGQLDIQYQCYVELRGSDCDYALTLESADPTTPPRFRPVPQSASSHFFGLIEIWFRSSHLHGSLKCETTDNDVVCHLIARKSLHANPQP